MTLFKRFSKIFIIVAKFVINCIVSLNNCCRSYYKFLCLYRCLFKHSGKAFLSINQCELIIYDTIEITKQNFKDVNDTHRKTSTHNTRNIQSRGCMCCTSMDYILMLIIDAVRTKCSMYELIDLLYIRFNTLTLDLIKFVILLHYQRNQAKKSSLFSIDWIVCLYLSDLGQLTIGYTLHLTLFILILHIILSYCTELSVFLNNSPTKQDSECIDMSGDEIVDAAFCICNCIVSLHHKLFDTYCCTAHIHVSMIISCVNQLKLAMCDTIEVVGTKARDMHDKHDKNICQDGRNNQSPGNMYGALMDYTLMLTVDIVRIFHSFYTVMHHEFVENDTLTYRFHAIIVFCITTNIHHIFSNTICDYFQSILRSIIAIIVRLFNIFMIIIGFHRDDCRSCYKLFIAVV